jgi:outer membrane murein-binding lipoprotein Lpp
MAKSTLFDRLNQELEAFGRKAQAALDDGKVQIDQMRVRRKRDNAARDLGLLIYRRERGGSTEARRVDALLARLDDLEAELAQLARQLDEARRRRPAARRSAAEPPQPPAGEPTQPAAGEPTQPAAGEPTQPAAGASA